MDGVQYFAVAHYSNGSYLNIDFKIYYWNGGSFVEDRYIPTSAGMDWEAFVVDGVQYLALAINKRHVDSSCDTDSIIYQVATVMLSGTSSASSTDTMTVSSTTTRLPPRYDDNY